MAAILHILTRSEDALARGIISRQVRESDTQAEVVDLAQSEPDYGALLEKIFAADSVTVW